jgi:hypothetical protein
MSFRPLVLGQGTLSGDGRRDRVTSSWEDEEEGVALRVDLVPPVMPEGVSEETAMFGQNLTEPFA